MPNHKQKVTPTFRENMKAIMEAAMSACVAKDADGIPLPNQTGVNETGRKLSVILSPLGFGSFSNTTASRFVHADINDSKEGIGPDGPMDPNLGKLAIALRIYPLANLQKFDLAKKAERATVIRLAAQDLRVKLNTPGFAETWKNDAYAQRWPEGIDMEKPVKPRLNGHSAQQVTVNSEFLEMKPEDLLSIGQQVLQALYQKAMNKSEKQPHMGGQHLRGLIQAEKYTETELAAILQCSEDELVQIMDEGKLMTKSQCEIAGAFTRLGFDWFNSQGCCLPNGHVAADH